MVLTLGIKSYFKTTKKAKNQNIGIFFKKKE